MTLHRELSSLAWIEAGTLYNQQAQFHISTLPITIGTFVEERIIQGEGLTDHWFKLWSLLSKPISSPMLQLNVTTMTTATSEEPNLGQWKELVLLHLNQNKQTTIHHYQTNCISQSALICSVFMETSQLSTLPNFMNCEK